MKTVTSLETEEARTEIDPEKYLTPKDFEGGRQIEIRDIKREIINGRPWLVLYFHGEERGLPLTKQLADDITASLGPHPMVEAFFRGEGMLH